MALDCWKDRDIPETQEARRKVTELSVLSEDSKESIFSLLLTDRKGEDKAQ
jgi:hypothetical protein